MIKINSLADLRPGDIGITRMGGVVPGFFPVRAGQWLCRDTFYIGRFSADHALICVQAAGPEQRGNSAPMGALFGSPGRYRTYPRGVQAMPRGAEEIALTPAKHTGDDVLWFRMIEDYPGQADDAAAIARLFVSEKIPYSFLSYLALAAWSQGWKTPRLEKWINRRREPVLSNLKRRGPWPGQLYTPRLPAEAICSVLVDQAWSLAGKRVMDDVAPQAVTPGALARRLWQGPTA